MLMQKGSEEKEKEETLDLSRRGLRSGINNGVGIAFTKAMREFRYEDDRRYWSSLLMFLLYPILLQAWQRCGPEYLPQQTDASGSVATAAASSERVEGMHGIVFVSVTDCPWCSNAEHASFA
jgi:hypothetical protein